MKKGKKVNYGDRKHKKDGGKESSEKTRKDKDGGIRKEKMHKK